MSGKWLCANNIFEYLDNELHEVFLQDTIGRKNFVQLVISNCANIQFSFLKSLILATIC